MATPDTSGFTLYGTMCSECGYIHPIPKNGICPIVKKKADDIKIKLKKDVNIL